MRKDALKGSLVLAATMVWLGVIPGRSGAN